MWYSVISAILFVLGQLDYVLLSEVICRASSVCLLHWFSFCGRFFWLYCGWDACGWWGWAFGAYRDGLYFHLLSYLWRSLLETLCWGGSWQVVSVVVCMLTGAHCINRAQVRKWPDPSSLLFWRLHQWAYYTWHGGVQRKVRVPSPFPSIINVDTLPSPFFGCDIYIITGRRILTIITSPVSFPAEKTKKQQNINVSPKSKSFFWTVLYSDSFLYIFVLPLLCSLRPPLAPTCIPDCTTQRLLCCALFSPSYSHALLTHTTFDNNTRARSH